MEMSFGRFIVIPIFISLQAFTMMAIAPYVPLNGIDTSGLIIWIAFQAWAMYFLAGCTPKMGAKVLIGYAGGIVASVAIFELGTLFAGMNAGQNLWGLYLAVFLVVIPVISMEKVPWFDFVPAYFLGAGVFFGLMTYLKLPADTGKYAWYGTLAVAEMVACATGLMYGAITVVFRGWYEAKVGEKVETPAEEKVEEAVAVS